MLNQSNPYLKCLFHWQQKYFAGDINFYGNSWMGFLTEYESTTAILFIWRMIVRSVSSADTSGSAASANLESIFGHMLYALDTGPAALPKFLLVEVVFLAWTEESEWIEEPSEAGCGLEGCLKDYRINILSVVLVELWVGLGLGLPKLESVLTAEERKTPRSWVWLSFFCSEKQSFCWECRSKHSTFCPIPLFWQLAPIYRTLLPEDRSSSSQDSLCRTAIYSHLGQPWTKGVFCLIVASSDLAQVDLAYLQ